MNFLKKLTAGVSALVLCAGMAVSGIAGAIPANAVDDTNDDWLHAVGSRLYDKDGNEVWLTGANWFGLNCSENSPHGLYATDCDAFLKTVSEHGINIIRMPISTQLLLSWMNGEPDPVQSVQASYEPPVDQVGEDGTVTKAGTYGNINKDFVESDGKTLKNSFEIFDAIIKKMKQYGLKVLIDVHSPTAHNSGHNYNIWYYDANTEAADTMAVTTDGHEITYDEWIDSVTWLAKQYANDDTILAYDLKNEPHGKRGYDGTTCPDGIARWDDSTVHNNWAYAATECGNSILNVNPNALILIEGVEQYPKTEKGYTYDTADIWQASAEVSPWYGAWWGGNLRGVKDYPIDFGDAKKNSQIVYSPHDYGPSVYEQTWFNKDFTTQTLLDDYWYDTWAYINDKDIAPLLIGEWGGHMDGGKNQKWMELLRDYMIDNHINHTFWCLNDDSGDTGGLWKSIQYNPTTGTVIEWDTEKYNIFESALWQTLDSGKFIGLDHQTALGANGISLNDFYTSYSSTEGSNLDGGKKSGGEPVISDGTTTTTATTVASTTTTQTETTDISSVSNIVYGDANCDNGINMADSVLILQSISNSDKYGENGTEKDHITSQGMINADCSGSGDGVTAKDALAIQKYLLDLITLPEE